MGAYVTMDQATVPKSSLLSSYTGPVSHWSSLGVSLFHLLAHLGSV